MKWMYFLFGLSVICGQINARPESSSDATTKLPEIIVVTTANVTTSNKVASNQSTDQNENRRALPFKDDSQTNTPSQSTTNQNNTISLAKEKSTAKAHAGIAIPMTMEEIEREIAEVDNHVMNKETSTPKEGISTWILLSGTNPTGKPINKGPTYRIESESNIEKLERLAKIEENGKPKEMLKNKYKAKPISTSTTISPPPQSVNVESNETIVKPNRPVNPKKKVEPTRPTKPTTTTAVHKRKPTTSTKAPITKVNTPKSTTEASINADDESSTTFIVMEAKDADFNLPPDRSPGKSNKGNKRPNTNNNANNKNKKKTNNVKKDKIDETALDNLINKNSTKSVNNNKIKDKPVTTQIYNYLAREVMPTVGVGLIGLVVTAGLAGYFFGPLGALRRSYDISDRKDDLYYYNNEEYAGPDGQSEEDMFGKVIAGMPLNTNYKNNANIRYTPSGAPNSYQPQPQNGPKYGYQQQYNGNNNNNRYPGRPQMPYINYQSNVKQPIYQKNHIHNPNAVLKKSISGPVYRNNNQQQQQQPILASPIMESFITTKHPATTTTSTTMLPTTTFSSQTETFNTNPSAAALHMEPETQSPVFVNPLISDYHANDIMQRSPAQQFVVGSVLPDVITGDEDNMAAPVPEHGPRRRRRSTEQLSNDITLKPIEDLYTKLKQKYSRSAKNDKIAKEMKNIDYEIQRLRRISAEVKDIVQFQNEFHIDGLNSDLRDTIANGIAHIQGNIQFVNELLDNPGDVEKKMIERKKMQGIVSSKTKDTNYPTVIQSKMDVAINSSSDATTASENSSNGTLIIEPPAEDNHLTGTSGTTASTSTIDGQDIEKQPTGLMGLLKLLELKAQFGINLMRSVRPAFNKAFRDVFNATQSSESSSGQVTSQYN